MGSGLVRVFSAEHTLAGRDLVVFSPSMKRTQLLTKQAYHPFES